MQNPSSRPHLKSKITNKEACHRPLKSLSRQVVRKSQKKRWSLKIKETFQFWIGKKKFKWRKLKQNKLCSRCNAKQGIRRLCASTSNERVQPKLLEIGRNSTRLIKPMLSLMRFILSTVGMRRSNCKSYKQWGWKFQSWKGKGTLSFKVCKTSIERIRRLSFSRWSHFKSGNQFEWTRNHAAGSKKKKTTSITFLQGRLWRLIG